MYIKNGEFQSEIYYWAIQSNQKPLFSEKIRFGKYFYVREFSSTLFQHLEPFMLIL
ncbi:hypothetical protein LOTGIDRAFT_198528 [Lottia gigantea]|uniref:Uncharacterized protein n=1 Tax=Lottia gigantea TaxID=225164 RepID=V4CQ93_LOTGI|nr:hypothetical protein LOTGIDRAFT_198528 [Lottia gigantea]ESP04630.1 hypothetical protein LOTGIDRAFT_198528 [Lottia gigantea]